MCEGVRLVTGGWLEVKGEGGCCGEGLVGPTEIHWLNLGESETNCACVISFSSV